MTADGGALLELRLAGENPNTENIFHKDYPVTELGFL
jgi:hypothetical protein